MRWIRAVLGLTLCCILGSPVAASPVRVEFFGEVRALEPGVPEGEFSIGDSVSGSFVYDTEATDTIADPTNGFYLGGVVAFDLVVGSYAGTLSRSSILGVRNDPCCNHRDSFAAQTLVLPDLGAPLARAQFALIDWTNSALSSDAIPSATELMEAFRLDDPDVQHDRNVNWLSFGVGSVVRWDVTDYSAEDLPEAGSSPLLLLAGVALLVGSGRGA